MKLDDNGTSRDGNLLLTRMAVEWAEPLARHLVPVDLPQGMVIEEPDEPVEHVYFPTSGVISIVAMSRERSAQIEAGLIGREGMSGSMLVLGTDRAPHQTTVQIGGSGFRLEAERLRAALSHEPLRERLLHYCHALSVQTAHTALANAKLKLDARLARWLLMCQDRTGTDEVPLTHDFLSVMLGVRRAGVTVSLHILEGQGLVRATRGLIRILDREGLEEMVGGCYGVPEAEYARLIGG
ncbi:Crp/Fnr family transcriptional regulator [Limimaricola variabilis]|uniref:Crp/Fnr family transcriptional regulator n=1 Tax=Limimaricola variabilis TaxID=1492771 RepID=UPI002AC996DC|nr:Crp/Fnr family transcriptional regulator [Limimaricola variabilis]WPY93556.1 Crp/Fnr family transcriptional regulator [Limimaricola variabilis]